MSKPGFHSFALRENLLAPARAHQLLKASVVEFFLEVDRERLMEFIEEGRLAWVFRINSPDAYRHRDLRIFAACLFEQLGMKTGLPKRTADMSFDEVMRLIWPYQRDPRGVELQKLLSIPPIAVRKLTQRRCLIISRRAADKHGPNASNNYSRESLAAFLRRSRFS